MARPKVGQTVLEETEDEEEGMPSPQMPPMASDVNLERLVAFPTWREMLLDLVHAQKMDPWNIDIGEIATKYLDRIKNLEIRDLRLPANLILAASILLRFKSDALSLEEEEQTVTPEVFVGEEEAAVEIPMIELRSRIPPRRQVTLDELMGAMEKVFEEQQKREEKAARRMVEIPSAMNIAIPEFDIEEEMVELYDRVEGSADKEGLVLFSALADMGNPQEVIYTLLPVLHLVQDKRVSIFQEEFFGEIFVRLIPGRRPPPKQASRGQMKLSVSKDAVLVGEKENAQNVGVTAAPAAGAGAAAAVGDAATADLGAKAQKMPLANTGKSADQIRAEIAESRRAGTARESMPQDIGAIPAFAKREGKQGKLLPQFIEGVFADCYFIVVPAPSEIVLWVSIAREEAEKSRSEKTVKHAAKAKKPDAQEKKPAGKKAVKKSIAQKKITGKKKSR
jgi:segregation and condensation protein A